MQVKYTWSSVIFREQWISRFSNRRGSSASPKWFEVRRFSRVLSRVVSKAAQNGAACDFGGSCRKKAIPMYLFGSWTIEWNTEKWRKISWEILYMNKLLAFLLQLTKWHFIKKQCWQSKYNKKSFSFTTFTKKTLENECGISEKN